MTMTKENAWDILNGKLTLPECIELLGGKDRFSKIDKMNITDYFTTCNMVKYMAYNSLLEMNEIDGSKIYNLANNSYESELDQFGDIGISKDGHFIFGNGWMKM